MALNKKYIWHGGDNSDGLSWATAYTSMSAFTAVHGDFITGTPTEILIASDHSEDIYDAWPGQHYPHYGSMKILSVNRTSGLYEKSWF